MQSLKVNFQGDAESLIVDCCHIKFSYSLASRTFSVAYKDKFHLRNARPYLRYDGQKTDLVKSGRLQWTIDNETNDNTPGKKLSIKITDEKRPLTIEQHFGFDSPDSITISTALCNRSDKDIRLLGISTLGGRGSDTALFVEEAAKDFFLLKDSWGGYNADEVITHPKKIRPEVSANFSLLYHPRVGSFAAGIERAPESITEFSYRLEDGSSNKILLGVTHRSTVADGIVKNHLLTIPAGNTFSPGGIVLMFGQDPWQLMDQYACRLQSSSAGQRKFGALCGWSSWHCLGRQVGEEEILRQTDFIAENLAGYGMQHLIVDLGWQHSGDVWGGPWQPGPKFPHKMKWLADQIHRRGLKAGIAIRPLDYEKTKLDPSTSFTRNLIRKETAVMTREWGFDLIKLNYLG